MGTKKGNLSIDSENIFPIIKKWVYSDHDIFIRELVSNGCDAITKYKKLDMMGECELPDDYKGKIQVIVNPEEKTLKFIDNGIGMTAEEVEEYITQIAFSGATQFLEKYKDKTTEDEMIGHFGLGFYSAFMVADEVQIDTLSYKEGAAAVHWVSEGGTEYEMQEGNRTEDYPFNLKGILYFPKINTEYDSIEGKIKLYNNQVFIADNIKEVIPEFLMVLKGVIDCPDLPLNVSRSALQNDGFVTKVADYISKKVADKLNGMFKTDRENYEKYWDDISPFIKFGCLKDEKFGEKVKDSMLFKNLDHKYLTLEDCIKANGGETAEETKAEETTDSEETKETPKTNIFYVTNEQQQSQYINMFKEQGQDAVILAHNIDSAFITYLEQKHDNVKFQRIDADVHESLKAEVAEEEKETFQKNADSLTEIFRKVLNNEKLDVKVEKLKDENIASMAVLSEESRRMEEMMKMYGMGGMDTGMFGGQASLILNADHPLVQYVVENKEGENVELICKQLYDLALLAHKPLSPQEMTAFVQRSNQIMMLLTK